MGAQRKGTKLKQDMQELNAKHFCVDTHEDCQALVVSEKYTATSDCYAFNYQRLCLDSLGV